MSLRAIPLIAIAFILYNLVEVLGVDLAHPIFALPMPSGRLPDHPVKWTFTWGDMLIILTLLLLFIELLKSTFGSASALIDHALSLVVMVGCLIEFLLVPQAATSVFFVILFATMIDVIAGYTISIGVARRNLNIADPNN